jgi:mannose-6-phosphate isomerase-like protein (cupin superfamily)
MLPRNCRSARLARWWALPAASRQSRRKLAVNVERWFISTRGRAGPGRRAGFNRRFALPAPIQYGGAMSHDSAFGGRATRTSLPAVEPGAVNQPPLKRLILLQGDLAQLYDADEGLRYLAWLELISGSVRGNHYHREKREFFYLISGRVDLVLEDPDSGARVKWQLASGDLVFLEPGIVHAYCPTADGQAVEFSPQRFRVEDTLRKVIVPPAG